MDDLINFVKVIQFNVLPILLYDSDTCWFDFDIGLLIRPDIIVRIPSSSVESCNNWMVRYLLSKILGIFCHHLECFSEERVERLGTGAFTHGEGRYHLDCDKCHAHARVLLCTSFVKDVNVLHALCTLLQKASRIIEIDWCAHVREIFSNAVLQNRPQARPCLRVFQPRQCISLQRFLHIITVKRYDGTFKFIFMALKIRLIERFAQRIFKLV